MQNTQTTKNTVMKEFDCGVLLKFGGVCVLCLEEFLLHERETFSETDT